MCAPKALCHVCSPQPLLYSLSLFLSLCLSLSAAGLCVRSLILLLCEDPRGPEADEGSMRPRPAGSMGYDLMLLLCEDPLGPEADQGSMRPRPAGSMVAWSSHHAAPFGGLHGCNTPRRPRSRLRLVGSRLRLVDSGVSGSSTRTCCPAGKEPHTSTYGGLYVVPLSHR